MTTSSSPCFFHSSRMYSASSLLRFDPAMWGSCGEDAVLAAFFVGRGDGFEFGFDFGFVGRGGGGEAED